MYNVHGRNCAIMQELLSKHVNFISIPVENVVGTENDIHKKKWLEIGMSIYALNL